MSRQPGYYVLMIQRGLEIANITDFDKEHQAVNWIKTKSQAWLLNHKVVAVG